MEFNVENPFTVNAYDGCCRISYDDTLLKVDKTQTTLIPNANVYKNILQAKEEYEEEQAKKAEEEFKKLHKRLIPGIKRVIFSNPATIIMWNDNSKTIVKCQEGDTYDKEKGLVMCIAKKALGNLGNFNDTLTKYLEEE